MFACVDWDLWLKGEERDINIALGFLKGWNELVESNFKTPWRMNPL